MKKLILIIPYFGKKPQWMEYFIASIAANKNVDFLMITDFPIYRKPDNLIHIQVDFEKYRLHICNTLNINDQWSDPYKLTDIKPCLGLIHYNIVKNYQFYGHSDLDLVFGDILSFYNEAMNVYDVISSHTYLLSGHLSIFRNRPENIYLFTANPDWKNILSVNKHLHYDEIGMTNILIPNFDRSLLKFATQYDFEVKVSSSNIRCLFKERYTTYNSNWLLPSGFMSRPQRWTWAKGTVINDIMSENIIYTHFSLWHSGKWFNQSVEHEAGIWKSNPNVKFPEINFDEIERFHITQDGVEIF